MSDITLESLIQEQRERISSLKYKPSPQGCIGLGYYYYDNSDFYQRWLATTKRFIGIKYPNDKDVNEFESISKEKLSPDQQKRLLAILEAFAALPKDVFRRYKHYGIYEWKHVYNLCNQDINSSVRALKFSQTQLFEKPIDYSTVTKIIGTKNTFASPVRISKEKYSEIYKLGHETK